MASFDFTVDTVPMADAIGSVSDSVYKVNALMLVMKQNILAAQAAAAKDICEKVDSGFYILLTSQLSQKIAAHISEMNSRILLMKRHRTEINHIKDLMMQDYNRIAANYLKIFKSLDDNLCNRISQLDNMAVKLGGVQESLSRMLMNEAADVAVYENEIHKLTQRSVEAVMKKRTLSALETLQESIEEKVRYNKSVGSIVRDGGSEETVCVPVAFCEALSFFDSKETMSKFYTPFSSDSLVDSGIINSLAGESGKWRSCSDEAYGQIKQLVLEKCQDVDARVAETIMQLFNASRYEEADI